MNLHTSFDDGDGPETITQLAKRLGKTRPTVWKWIVHGVAVGGTCVKLAAQKIGAQWVIYPEQYKAFVEACNPGRFALPESPMKEQERWKRAQAALARKLG